MHIYAFGSICRGDVTSDSDVDLLAIVSGYDARFSQDDYSIYSYDRIKEIWADGNPFAWHLSLESKLLYSSDQLDFLVSLGEPRPYGAARRDCEKFRALFREARDSFISCTGSNVFDLSVVFLAIRNFAACYSLGVLDKPDFSRHSAIRLGPYSLSLSRDAYEVLERARVLCTRAVGTCIMDEDADIAAGQFSHIEEWMNKLLMGIRDRAA
jgi:hypothetical protein